MINEKNVLFVYPPVSKKNEYYTFPLGMAYVYAYAKKRNIKCFSLNLNHVDEAEKSLKDAILANDIDIIASGGISYFWNEIEYVFVTAKRIKRGIISVCGGSIMTSTPELAMKNLPVDYGVIGEGEITFFELISTLNNNEDISKVDGIIFRDTAGILQKSLARKPIMDLDELPFPDYSAFGFQRWLETDWIFQPSIKGLYYNYNEPKRIVEIIGSRSCPYECSFCYHPLGKVYRQRSIENIFSEIEMLVKDYKINLLNFLDELFSLDEKRITEISGRIKKYNIKWMAQWRVDAVNENIMKTIKNSNVFLIGLGVESLNDRVLKSMKKKISAAQVKNALSIAEKAGIRTGSNLIFGDVEETEDSAKESLNWALKNKQYDFAFDFIMAIPDSPIYRHAVNNKIITDELQHIKKKFPVVNLSGMTRKEFEKLKRKVIFINITNYHKISAKVINSIKTSIVYRDRQIYSFNVECPLCGHTSKFEYYMFSQKPHFTVLCKNCYKTLRLRTGDVFFDEYSFIKSHFFLFGLLMYHLYLYRFIVFKKFFLYLTKK